MKNKKNRECGILMPISSLHSRYGIGTLGKAAYEFADFVRRSGCTLWQVLPVGPTGYGDSPYQTFSAFAGNPYFIDLDILIDEGLLKKSETAQLKNSRSVDYKAQYETRFEVLKAAFSRFDGTAPEYRAFLKKHSRWLDDYSLFSALKTHFGGADWRQFPKSAVTPEGVREYGEKLMPLRNFERFMQYQFYKQWNALHKYCKSIGVSIIGDIPIYTSLDSADVLFSPELFQLDENLTPTAVAGCPPDDFSQDGQLWGNPLYDYEYHRKTGYKWWIDRIAHSLSLYDIVRIDHFRGFAEYYSIPYGETTAKNGEWKKGPGYDLFKAAEKKLGSLPIIAEDLGNIDEKVRRLLKKTGFPGMKVLQFAFGGGWADNRNSYLPHEYGKNCVVYTGTHDNPTTRSYFESCTPETASRICEYFACDKNTAVASFVRAAIASRAKYAVIPMADILELGDGGRINTPSTLGGNWTFRIGKSALSDENAEKIRRMCELYGRAQPQYEEKEKTANGTEKTNCKKSC